MHRYPKLTISVCASAALCAASSLAVRQKAEFVPVNILMTWTKAQTYCRTHYTDLASVRSSAENKDVFAKKPSGAHWLGLYRDTWKWSDGDGDAFSYWSGTQPAGSTEHCATAYFSDSGRWRDWLCSYTKPFICHHGRPYLYFYIF
uniref:C-type lectin domain-containing protein n=1 Tax=Fundulus heteroclitus TaxID=8078 RepID=A0A3Q2QP01_FUNHE